MRRKSNSAVSIKAAIKRRKHRIAWKRVKTRALWSFIVLAAIAVALFVPTPDNSPRSLPSAPSASNSGARTISASSRQSRVIDADTIVVGSIRVRLNGISAAERGHPTYQEAKQFVAQLMRSAQKVECKLEGRMSFNREVGACWFITSGGLRIDPQAEVVKAGLARDCPRYSGGRYRRFETRDSRALPLPGYC